MKLSKFAKALWTDEQGQSTTEYILILAVVVMIALKFKQTIGGRIAKVTDQLGTQIDTAEIGRASCRERV